MYYVFYVNDGYMLALDLAAVGHFRDLSSEVTLKTGIAPKDQVFLLGGGEALIGDYLLSAYEDAGSETNPVYLIKRVTGEKDPINSREEEGINNVSENWKREIEQLSQQQPRSSLVNHYVDRIEEGVKVAETLLRYCDKIVTEHQYLNHAWRAVTRNMDENASQIGRRYHSAAKVAERLPLLKKRAKSSLGEYDVVLQLLEKIKVPNYMLTNSVSSSSSDTTISLYEWISKQDDEFTLEQLFEHASQHIEKLDELNIQKAYSALKTVKELVKRNDYKEIRGIDNRLTQLDQRLGEMEQILKAMREDYGSHMKLQGDTGNYRTIIPDQRNKISKMSNELNGFTKNAHSFLRSKVEILQNIRQRLSGWIKQSYDKLQNANTDLLVFEKKFSGFRQRIDLVQQIRDAPVIFASCVAEVIRRHRFKSEFDNWFMQFSQKASELLRDENTTRAEFYVKLEKHFLRQIFKGMSDELPNFCPRRLTFDQNLPALGPNDLRNLRESLKDYGEASNVFKVTSPQVYSRLMVEDPSNPRVSQPSLHREESFFVKDQNRVYQGSRHPSTNWLNEDGQVEMSPSSQSFFTRTLGSTTSLNAIDSQVTTPSDLMPSLDQINLMRRDSIPREAITPSSVDLNCPLSIHPDKFPRVTSPLKLRRGVSRGSTQSITSLEREYPKPIFEEGVPVESPPEDVFLPCKTFPQLEHINERPSQTSTPLYTPVLSPTGRHAEDKESQTDFTAQECSTQVTKEENEQSVQTSTLESPDISVEMEHVYIQSAPETSESSTQYSFESVCQEVQTVTECLEATTQMDLEVNTASVQAVMEHVNAEVQHIVVFNEASMQTDDYVNEKLQNKLVEVMDFLKNFKSTISEVKQSSSDDINSLSELLNSNIAQMLTKIAEGTEGHKAKIEESVQKQVEDYAGLAKEKEEQLAVMEKEKAELKDILDHEKYLRKEKESELNEKTGILKNLNEEMLSLMKTKDDLQAEVTKLTAENVKLEAKSESDPSDNCLLIELDVISQAFKRDLKEDEINWIKQEVEKRRNMKGDLQSSQSDEEAVKKEYENAYKNKVAFLIKGIEDKKNSELTKLREDIEAEVKEENERYILTLTNRITELEKRQQVLLSYPTVGNSMNTSMSGDMLQSCIVLEDEANKFANDLLEKAEEGVQEPSRGSPELKNEVSVKESQTQTKLKLADMKMMVSLHDVSEGSGVLLVYNDSYKSYLVFSSSNQLYFVKEKSLKRLGIEPGQTDKFTLLFARVSAIELCETKKAPNRYNLPAGNRFYRVDVIPMPPTVAGLALQIQVPKPHQKPSSPSQTASTSKTEEVEETSLNP